MGEFSHIIDGMTWSFSRIESFEQCPYGWLSKYIYGEEQRRLFFSDFGSFIHDILRRLFAGELDADELGDAYLMEFSEKVSGYAPSRQIVSGRFQDGYSYLRSPISTYHELKSRNVLAVEQSFVLNISDIPFTGVIDLVTSDHGDIVVTDHKSTVIKPPSGRKKPTLYDIDREKRARQLYLYALAVKEAYGQWPARLEFNCFRVPEIISIPFNEKAKDEAVAWALDSVQNIQNCDEFSPKVDYFYCKNLCDLKECPYRDFL